jgi:hypothetical protein
MQLVSRRPVPVIVVALSLFLCSAGCDGDARPESRRTPLGKGDAVEGSCQGQCGGRSPDGCYCDSKCEAEQDCCLDKPMFCTWGCRPSDCGRGSFTMDGCFCDDLCERTKTCCFNKREVCGP